MPDSVPPAGPEGGKLPLTNDMSKTRFAPALAGSAPGPEKLAPASSHNVTLVRPWKVTLDPRK